MAALNDTKTRNKIRALFKNTEFAKNDVIAYLRGNTSSDFIQDNPLYVDFV